MQHALREVIWSLTAQQDLIGICGYFGGMASGGRSRPADRSGSDIRESRLSRLQGSGLLHCQETRVYCKLHRYIIRMNRANVQQENMIMALVRMLRGGQVTLPAEARKALRLQEGDYLDLTVNGSTLTLKPVQVVDRAEADRQLDQILSQVRYAGPAPEPAEDEVMDTVVERIRAVRAAKYAKSRTR